MTKTAKIYGDSLYDLAAEEKLTEEILPQMEQVAVLFKENPDFHPENRTCRAVGQGF